jgi:replicative DNA helicase
MVSDSLFGASLREPPVNMAAEQALLGGLLANNNAFERVGGFLRAEHFADEFHQRIFAAIERRVNAGQVADAVTLQTEFDKAYLASLLIAMVAPMLCGEYARAVVDAWMRRQICALAIEADQAARDPETVPEAADLLGALQDRLASLMDDMGPARGPTTLAEAVESARDRAEAMHRGEDIGGPSTGIAAIDDKFGRFLQPATLTYLAGLGEVGKTTLALQIAENVARDAWQRWQAHKSGPCPGVLFFSFDMTARQIGMRSAARLGEVSARKLRKGQLDDDVCLGLIRAQRAADALPIEIDDGEPPSLQRVVQSVRRFVRKRPCVAVVIDNLSKLIGEGKLGDALFPAFLNATNTLKKLANRLGIPIVLLVHLPQTVAKRDNPMPRRGDLPYGIHLHADTALGLWRPELALASTPPERGRMTEEAWAKMANAWNARKAALRGVAELVPLKLREDDGDGQTVVRLAFDHTTGSFYEPEP